MVSLGGRAEEVVGCVGCHNEGVCGYVADREVE